MAESGSLCELAGDSDTPRSTISDFGDAALALARLTAGARRRLGEAVPADLATLGPELRALDLAVMSRARSADGSTGTEGEPAFDLGNLANAVAGVIEVLRADLPAHLAEVAANVLAQLIT